MKRQGCRADAKPADLSRVGQTSAPTAGQFGRLSATPTGKRAAPVRRPLQWVDDKPDVKDMDWLVQDLIPKASAGFLVAAPKTGKSALALNFACHLALGLPFFGKRIT